ncbi:MAG: hypothetical protein IT368_05590 [Candidatus Hydrogenedentes bacterium]|nr:hypothetical protein [Candidatus Hydrogenedentota bacterium]
MRYEYSGFLRTLMHAPDPRAREYVDHVYFSADDLQHWSLTDRKNEKEWQQIPVTRERTPEGVRLEGRFTGVRRIDNVGEADPSFWVALSSVRGGDGRWPVDTQRFPIMEVTYRCTSAGALPAVVWEYTGGEHFDGLKATSEWRTIVRRVQYHGFPERVNGVTFRLYSATRTVESFEIQSICFRAMTPAEGEASWKKDRAIEESALTHQYPLLNDFMPFGCYMSAATTKHMAELMEVTFRDYLRLAFEDMARQFHNAIILQDVGALSEEEWRELLAMAHFFGIKVLALHEWRVDQFKTRGKQLVDRYIRPYADSPALLGWSIYDEPPEYTFEPHLYARSLIEEADPNHPLTVIMRSANAFPLFAPYFAASGISHFKSRSPWDLGTLVKRHLPLTRGQQFWITAPAFVWATDTPEWSTCPEIRLMLNLAFANGARGWFAYTYHNDPIWIGGNCQRSLTGPFLCFSDLWTEMGQRMERFSAMAPLFLNASPVPPEDDRIGLTGKAHTRSRLEESIPPYQLHILQAADYRLYYLVNNDVEEVTSANLDFTRLLDQGLAVYDMTDFVRSRVWSPSKAIRHLEMFPGQGQIFLAAEPQVCNRWRDVIVERLIENDRRQIGVDLGLARRYDLDVSSIQRLLQELGMGKPMDELQRVHEARDLLLNAIYSAPAITDCRTKLIEVSALLCACDGSLCRLLGRGKGEAAQELGTRLLPIARELTQMRLKLRRGHGREILDSVRELSRQAQDLLLDIRRQP